MSSLKPVIHGRDHLPGGADPIPVAPIIASVLSSDEEHLQHTSSTIAASTSAALSWSRYAGGTFLDLSTPTEATVTTKGLYIATLSVQIDPPGGGVTTVGDPEDIGVAPVQFAGPAWFPGSGFFGFSTFAVTTDTILTYMGSSAVTAIMRIDGGSPDYFIASVFNRSSTYSITVDAAMSVVKVFDLP